MVLDEVSSSIDVATDKFIQRVVREEFAGATIIRSRIGWIRFWILIGLRC